MSSVRRIGILNPNARPPPAESEELKLYAALSELGWVQGKNLLSEERYANGRAELLQPFAQELLRLKVEVIVTNGTPATLAAKTATTTIPIVISSSGDPVRTGLVGSLARPGGNVTGYSIVGPELNAKRLALLRELLPAVQRVGYLENSTNPYYRVMRGDFERACQSLDIQPIFVTAAAADELANAVAEVARRRGQALLVPSDLLFNDNWSEIMRIALKHALPTMVESRTEETGALISYNQTQAERVRRVAAFVDRILRGANPADLPIEQPTKFELSINLKTAKILGITVPQSLLLRADELVQ